MNKIITAIIFLTLTPCSFSMQKYEKQLEDLLAFHQISTRRNHSATMQMREQHMIGRINNDDLAGVSRDLTFYATSSETSKFVCESRQRLSKFALLNLAIKSGWHPTSSKKKIAFYERRKIAFQILELIMRHPTTISLHAAIQNLDEIKVKQCLRNGAILDWKDASEKNSFDHLYAVHDHVFKQPYNGKCKRQISAIKKLLIQRRNQVFVWKIENHDFELVKRMVALGSSPRLFIPGKRMTALILAQNLSGLSDDKHQHLLIFNFLRSIAEQPQVTKHHGKKTTAEASPSREIAGASAPASEVQAQSPQTNLPIMQLLPAEVAAAVDDKYDALAALEHCANNQPPPLEPFKYFVSLL